jgi:hypothetical protein
VKRRIILAITAAVLSLGVAAPAAYADPSFGPGNRGGTGNNNDHSNIGDARGVQTLRHAV